MDGQNYTHPTLEKISSLRAKFTDPAYDDDLTKINALETDLIAILAREAVVDSVAMQALLKEFKADADKLEEEVRTSDSETLPDTKRDRALDKIRLYRRFTERFDLKKINQEILNVDNEVQAELDGLQ